MMRHLLICSQWALDQVVLVVDALVRFNKNVFVGLIFLGPTIRALVSKLLVLMGPNVQFFISYFFHKCALTIRSGWNRPRTVGMGF